MKQLIPLTIALGIINVAFAERLPIDQNAELKIGINVGLANDGYRTDNSLSVLPHAFYDNNRWYIEGSEGGFYPYKDDKNHFRVGISYDGRHFDPEQATLPTHKQLSERHFSVLAHASYMHITPVGGFRTKIAIDALARHEAASGTVAHLSRFKFYDDKLTVYPSFGVAWYSKQYNRYYYGVTQNESKKTNLPQHTPNSSFSPYASVMAEYQLADKWSLFGHGRIEKLAKTQKDSPLVDGSLSSTARFGVSYSF